MRIPLRVQWQSCGRIVVDNTKLLCLVGQFPAVNHGYLLAEIQRLRELGIAISVASVSPSDRPFRELSPLEQEEAARTFYIKSIPATRVALSNLIEFAGNPLHYLGGLVFAFQLTRGNLGRIAYHAAYFTEAILVGRRMREIGVSHVHAHFSATVALIAARVFPITMSFTVHGFGELHDPVGTCLAKRIEGALFVRSVSRYGRGQLMLSCDRNQWSKLLYVPLGIDASKFIPRPNRSVSSQPRLLCVGRLSPEKGQGLLLEAVAALRAEGRPLHLKLVGDGPDRPWLERRAAELGLSSTVEFAGWVDPTQIRAIYNEAEVFVLPSLAEGVPVVLMEAMAMQLPCVAPRIGGIPELIEDGVDGILFAGGDIDDLTQQLRSLIEFPELCAQLAKRARARVVRDYDMARNAGRFAEALTQQLRNVQQG